MPDTNIPQDEEKSREKDKPMDKPKEDKQEKMGSFMDLKMELLGKVPQPTSLFDFLVPKTRDKPQDPRMMAERLSMLMEQDESVEGEVAELQSLLEVLDTGKMDIDPKFKGFLARVEKNKEYLKEVMDILNGNDKDRDAYGDVFAQINKAIIPQQPITNP